MYVCRTMYECTTMYVCRTIGKRCNNSDCNNLAIHGNECGTAASPPRILSNSVSFNVGQKYGFIFGIPQMSAALIDTSTNVSQQRSDGYLIFL